MWTESKIRPKSMQLRQLHRHTAIHVLLSVLISLLFITSCKYKEQHRVYQEKKCDTVLIQAVAKCTPISIKYAKGFSVEYRGLIKIVRILKKKSSLNQNSTYILVPKGMVVPKNLPKGDVIFTPVGRVITTSTTFLPHLEYLNQLNTLVGVSHAKYVYSPKINALIKSGMLAEVGSDQHIQTEKVLTLIPDIVFTYPLDGKSPWESNQAFKNANICIVHNADYLEQNPLGRAEWIKFTSLFFNAESMAISRFADVERAYLANKQIAKDLKNKPNVMVGSMYGGVWYVPGGNSFTSKLIADAGGKYIWDDDSSVGGVPLNFEQILKRAKTADIWINPSSWKTLRQGTQEDARYRLFNAFATKQVYNNNARMNLSDGNDIYESGSANPHLVLADLIRVLHPELLPNHQLKWYHRLP